MSVLSEIHDWTDWFAFMVSVVVGTYLIIAVLVAPMLNHPLSLAGMVVTGWVVTYIAVIELGKRMSV